MTLDLMWHSEQLWPFSTFWILHIWRSSLFYERNNSFSIIVQDQPVSWFMVQTSGVSDSAFIL